MLEDQDSRSITLLEVMELCGEQAELIRAEEDEVTFSLTTQNHKGSDSGICSSGDNAGHSSGSRKVSGVHNPTYSFSDMDC